MTQERLVQDLSSLQIKFAANSPSKTAPCYYVSRVFRLTFFAFFLRFGSIIFMQR